MPPLSIGNPYFVIAVRLVLLVIGVAIFSLPAADPLVYGQRKPQTAENTSMEPVE